MTEIIISLRLESEQEESDLEVSNDQTIGECIDFIASQRGWLTPALAYMVEAFPGRFLSLDLTFQQERIWNGAALIFHPPGGGPKEAIQQPAKQPSERNGYLFQRLD